MDDLEKYLLVLFEGQEGYIYTPVRTLAGEWRPHFYHWPEEKIELSDWIKTEGQVHDVYICPSLFSEKSARKPSAKGSQVCWVEFDGQEHIDLSGLPRPNAIVQTSSDTHVHVYWRIPFGTPTMVESINRRLTYGLEADSSGWDINQVLRPPLTRNFKHGLDVNLRVAHRNFTESKEFDRFPEPPQLVSFEDITTLPDPIDVIGTHVLSNKIWQMIKQPELAKGLRSTFLMHLGYELAETGLKHDEIVSLLVVVDEKVGKFVGRHDRLIRLAEIASIAVGKFGAIQQLPVYNYEELLNFELSIEHLWSDILTRKGSVLLSGEPGVGKTQFAFHVATSLCLGQSCLAGNVLEPLKTLFFSLEMNELGCKYILANQVKGLDKEQLARLRDSFWVVPRGYAMSLEEIETEVKRLEPNGIFIDTMSETVKDKLTEENEARRVVTWDAKIRNELGIFSWWNHHTRKANSENKAPIKISDIYGSFLYAAKMESIMILHGSRDNKGPIKWVKPKVRFGQSDKDGVDIVRTPNLTFDLKNKVADASNKPDTTGGDDTLTIEF